MYRSKAVEDRQPCYKPNGKDESELCAQWKAARAGEGSALWAERTFWLGVVGMIITVGRICLLLRSIRQGEVGLEAARKANAIAQEIFDKQSRPLVIFQAVNINSPNPLTAFYIYTFKSIGSGPLKVIRTFVDETRELELMI